LYCCAVPGANTIGCATADATTSRGVQYRSRLATNHRGSALPASTCENGRPLVWSSSWPTVTGG
jgi:hypothetical protein